MRSCTSRVLVKKLLSSFDVGDICGYHLLPWRHRHRGYPTSSRALCRFVMACGVACLLLLRWFVDDVFILVLIVVTFIVNLGDHFLLGVVVCRSSLLIHVESSAFEGAQMNYPSSV